MAERVLGHGWITGVRARANFPQDPQYRHRHRHRHRGFLLGLGYRPTLAMLRKLAALGRSRPIAASFVTATTKTAAADLVTQRCLEGRADIDARRTGLFTVFGFWYLGGFQYWLYVQVFSSWFPAAARFGEHATLAARLRDHAGLKALAGQTALGNFVHIPFLFFPAFYLTQEFVQRGHEASATAAMRRYATNASDDLYSAWLIWVPGHAIFFSVPLWLRLPMNHAMSFAFVCVLSLMRGSSFIERDRS